MSSEIPFAINVGGSTGWLVNLFAIASFIAGTVIHISFAIGVYMHANHNATHGKQPVFVHPLIWVLATLVGGIYVAVAYWLMHASTLVPASTNAEEAGRLLKFFGLSGAKKCEPE